MIKIKGHKLVCKKAMMRPRLDLHASVSITTLNVNSLYTSMKKQNVKVGKKKSRTNFGLSMRRTLLLTYFFMFKVKGC